MPSEAFSQLQALAGRAPQAQVDPVGLAFSVAAFLQVHSPAGRARHEHRAPATVFSVFAFSQVQLRADCLPQEHLASAAQTQASPERPQQVLGTVMVIWEGLVVEALLDCWCMVV